MKNSATQKRKSASRSTGAGIGKPGDWRGGLRAWLRALIRKADLELVPGLKLPVIYGKLTGTTGGVSPQNLQSPMEG